MECRSGLYDIGPRGTKRSLSNCNGNVSAALGAEGEACALTKNDLLLQLISEFPAALAVDLASLGAEELRPWCAENTLASMSSMSSGSSISTEILDRCASDSSVNLKMFGRQELRGKIPSQLNKLHQPGQPPQSFSRFVSRDLFKIEILAEAQPIEISTALDSLDNATLEMCSAAAPDSLTLPMVGIPQSPSPWKGRKTPLAIVTGIAKSGLHVQSIDDGKWSWREKEIPVEIHTGDRIALLLESPPGSFVSGPERDLDVHEARCLLGVEFKRRGNITPAAKSPKRALTKNLSFFLEQNREPLMIEDTTRQLFAKKLGNAAQRKLLKPDSRFNETMEYLVGIVLEIPGGGIFAVASQAAFTSLVKDLSAEYQPTDKDPLKFPKGYMTHRLKGLHASSAEFRRAIADFSMHTDNDRWPSEHEASNLPKDGGFLIDSSGYCLLGAVRFLGLPVPPWSWERVGTKHLAALQMSWALRKELGVVIVKSDTGTVHGLACIQDDPPIVMRC